MERHRILDLSNVLEFLHANESKRFESKKIVAYYFSFLLLYESNGVFPFHMQLPLAMVIKMMV